MSVSNLFKTMGLQWLPDANSVAAPEGALLRADNLVPDQIGALALRKGSSLIYSSLQDTNLDSLHTVELADGVTYRVIGADNNLYINGASQGLSFDGSGDVAIGDDSYQIFAARGTVKKKYDGDLNNWGIAAPGGRPLLAGIAAITKSAAGFDNVESPATAATEGSASFVADYAGTATSASQLTPNATTSRGSLRRLWTTDQDFYDISGSLGSDTDLFDLYVKLEDPSRVDKITITFGCDDSSTEPFTTDRFDFTFDLRNSISVSLKDPKSEGYNSYEAAVQAILSAVQPTAISSVQTPAQVKNTLSSVGNSAAPKTGVRPDPDAWFHLSVTRGQFKRMGATTGRGWNTIRGFQVTVENQKGYASKATFADALFIGGGDRTLTGTFKCVIRFARQTDQYIELSPPSLESLPINLNHQTLQVTIPSTLLTGADPQIDQVWIYLFGGFLDTYYRFEVASGTPSTGMTMDELTNPDGSDFDDGDERSRLTSHGMTMQIGATSSDIIVTLNKSELDALTENERLEPYVMGPPDHIMAIAGPWNGRMFTMTTEGYVYPSSNRSPSSFNSLQVINLTKYGNPLWMAKTGNGIVCGCEKDIVYLAGTGDDSDDLTIIDLYPQPLNVGNPPIDGCFHVDGNTVFYRSSDGLMALTGGSVTPMPTNGTSLLWRQTDRHGVSALNVETGRFRCAVDNHMFYMLAPEGSTTSSNVIYRYAAQSGKWSRLVFDQVATFRSIYNDPDGSLIAGDSEGNLWLLEDGDLDDGQHIAVTLLTPISDGGNPLAYKEAHDLQIHCDTAGDTGTIYVFKDGSSAAEDTSYEFATPQHSVYRHNMNDLGRFLKLQLRINGEFNRLSLTNFDITYRVRPQHSMKLDTGYLLPEEPGDKIWLQEVEFDANVYGNVTFELWMDDVLSYSEEIVATDGVRTPYRLVLPRGSKSYRPRLVFYSSDSAGEGSVGFECYSVRVRARGTGNQSQRGYLKVWPVGDAP